MVYPNIIFISYVVFISYVSLFFQIYSTIIVDNKYLLPWNSLCKL